jgi:lysophospholipid acyltransferase (LPLAT)-like uncharacterized protein
MSRNVFQYADLSGYSLKNRLLIRSIAFLSFAAIYLVGKTIRFELDGKEIFKKIVAEGKLPILAFWHNRLFLGGYFNYWYLKPRNFSSVMMVSESFDGEYISRCSQRLGVGIVRGSSNRGGIKALAQMISEINKGHIGGFTVDGPRGPKYVAKIGICLAAKKTSNPILPMIFEIDNFWEVKSWDNLRIPKPFSRVLIKVSEPIYIENEINREDLENKRLVLQKTLDDLVKYGENWRIPKVVRKD